MLLLLLLFFVLPPQPFPSLTEGAILDQSWQVGLVDQFLHGAQDGADLVFTYGPWGFLGDPRGNPAIYPWQVFGLMVLALGVSAGAALLAASAIRGRVWQCLWLLSFAALLTPWIAPPFLLYAVVFETAALDGQPGFPRRLSLFLLVPACALSAHVKLVALPLAVLLGLLILIDEAAVRRRVPWISAGLAFSYAALYFAAGQHAASFIPYLRGAFATMSGYSAGMALSGPAADAVVGALFCLLAPLAYAAGGRRRGWMALAGAAWVAAYFFMAFKQAFVRQDGGHIWAGILMFAVPASLIVVLFSRKIWFAVMVAAVAATTAYFAWTTAQTGDLRAFLAARLGALKQLPLAFQPAARRQDGWRQSLDAIREAYRIAPLPGSVDIFPTDILALLASSANYRPRPVFQSYAAVNPYLARLNADFLAGPKAPDFVLQNAGSMDYRFPGTEDNLAWLEILAHYQPAGFTGEYLALRKTPDAAPIHREIFLERMVTWNQDVELPVAGPPVWAEIDIQVQPLGRLIDFLFRPPAVNLNVEDADARTTYRLVVPLARSGFLLSPVVENPGAFALLYRGAQSHPLSPDVSRISVSTESGGSQFYRPRIGVRLYRLRLPVRPVPEMLEDDKLHLAESMHSAAMKPDWNERPDWTVAAGGLRLESNAPAAGSLSYDGAAATLDVAFGLVNQCDDPEPRLRVEFRVSYRKRDGSADRMLLRRVLEVQPSAEVTAAEMLPLPKGMPGSLQFATTPLEGNCHLGAYWSRVLLR